MKAANSSTTSKAAKPIESARARLVAAQRSVETAKHERQSAKRRRKQADLAARRAKKQLRRAREELDDAQSALATAESNYSEQLKEAIRAKKRPRPKVVKPTAAKKVKKAAPRRLRIPTSATPQPVVIDGAPASEGESSPMVVAASLDDTTTTDVGRS